MTRIYLDYNASTPLDPRVVDGDARGLRGGLRQSLQRALGGCTRAADLDTARGQVANLLGCTPDEIVFTSGGSEANNLALKGLTFARGPARTHLITTQVEHPATLMPCAFLQSLGAKCTFLPVDGTGRVDPDAVRRAITKDTALISVMHANNEVGTIEPIEECARIAREHGDPLPHRRSAVRGQDPDTSRTISAWICCRSRATSCTRPRAWARSTSALA